MFGLFNKKEEPKLETEVIGRKFLVGSDLGYGQVKILDGSQKIKVCDTNAFQVYNANLDIYHEINGSTSVTAEYKDGYILYTCFQLKEAGDEKSNPPSYYKLDLNQNTLKQVEN